LVAAAVFLDRHQDAGGGEETAPNMDVPAIEVAAATADGTSLPEPGLDCLEPLPGWPLVFAPDCG
jgi:hypothetical protein